MLSIILNLLVGLAAFITTTDAIPTISAVGSKFFTSEGNQFFIKGVAYQMTDDDPLVDTAQCELDAALMATLGVNSIRVYHVDATANHEGCMNAFAQKGIYAWVDMDSFYTYIRYQGEPPSWNQTKSDSYRSVMDAFQQYDNLAGLFVGNEVLNIVSDSGSAPFLLAAAVDLKGYRKAKGYREIPIGYSATDTTVLRPMLQDYLVCRPNATERLDFYSLNSYEWCGDSSYMQSGYDVLQDILENFPVPVFFSEDGCNTQATIGEGQYRNFADQQAIFTPPMVELWSGAIIYEWIEEINHYGLVEYGPQNTADPDQGTSVIAGFTRLGTPTALQDFSNLQTQWETLSPTGVQLTDYEKTYTTTPPACPAFTANGWTVDPSAALPTIGQTGVTSGMPTVTTGKGSASATAAHSASATTGAAGKVTVNPLSTSGEIGFLGCLVALITVGAGAVFLL